MSKANKSRVLVAGSAAVIAIVAGGAITAWVWAGFYIEAHQRDLCWLISECSKV